MKTLIFLLASTLLLGNGFKKEHLKNKRVKEAYADKESAVDQLLKKQDLKKEDLSIFIRVFKEEKELEIWGKSIKSTSYKLIQSYSICSASGTYGPKRKSGDYQVPEGLYHLEEYRFNPVSSFYLSLGINYPNASDKKLGNKKNPGGDIYIHGNCVSIGCMAMTDDKIKEIYIMAVEARNNGQKKIPVFIFPCKMKDKKMEKLYDDYPQHKAFWENLKPAYTYFENNKKVPSFAISSTGQYTLK